MQKIMGIVREEMDTIGAGISISRVRSPESGKHRTLGRHGRQHVSAEGSMGAESSVLGMTHEEVMTVIARGELRSYKQLPQIWYQIQTKFRDEPRPKSGLLRVRQFIMKDSYTFDIDAAGLDAAYEKHSRLLPDLPAMRSGVYGGGGAFRRHGRESVARVHGGVGGGRGFRGGMRRLRLCGQPGEGRGEAAWASWLPIPKAILRPKCFTPGAAKPSSRWRNSPVCGQLTNEESGVGSSPMASRCW